MISTQSKRLYQNKHIRALEALSTKAEYASPGGLMLKAGTSAFEILLRIWRDVRTVAVCCGKGNNGGDGFVVARLAHEYGLSVEVFMLTELAELAPEAKAAADLAISAGVPVQRYSEHTVLRADLIVDAVLGSGITGEVKEPYASLISAINASNIPVFSLDVPSGICVDTGQILGVAINAEATVTFIGLKQGLFTGTAPAYCGEIYLSDLGIPADLLSNVPHDAELLEWEESRLNLPRRERDTHKGHYGHVLIIGGDYGMGGAVRMAAEAAMRVGAGLVSVATRPEHVPVVNCSRPEIMCHKVVSAGDLEPLLTRATVIVIGPGLGQSEWSRSLFNRILSTDHIKVLDADSLNLLSESPVFNEDWVLTPHPGEAARLMQMSTAAIQNDRFTAVDQLQKKYGGVMVLKGVGTLIKSSEVITKVCRAGNPGMATGGMGDVLSGVIGGLLAQDLEPQEAAETGVLVHSMAADLAASAGGERGLLATDLMMHLRALVNPDDINDEH